jgi:hypothetical protein
MLFFRSSYCDADDENNHIQGKAWVRLLVI